MSRKISISLILVFLVLTFFQGKRALNLLIASGSLNQLEGRTQQIASFGSRGRPILQQNLQILKKIEKMNPSDVGIEVARAGQYLVMGRNSEAIVSYKKALEFEPRPEIYLNLARAYLAEGDEEAARENFVEAIRLDTRLIRHTPGEWYWDLHKAAEKRGANFSHRQRWLDKKAGRRPQE